jgi:hypothetical protein
MVGQTLLCPKCHQPLTIVEESSKGAGRGGGGVADLFDEAGIEAVSGPRCTRCGAPLKPNAVMCVECGTNLQTGERVEGAKVRKSGERGHGEAADVLLERAAKRIHEDKVEERKTRAQGLPAWIYFVMLSLLIGFCVSMFMIPKDQAFRITGFVIIGISALYSTYLSIRILIVAFSESLAQGLLCLFVPFYILIFIITRWDMVGGLFLLQLGCSVVAGIGAGIVAMAPMMKAEDGPGQAQLPSRPVRQDVLALAPNELPLPCTLHVADDARGPRRWA